MKKIKEEVLNDLNREYPKKGIKLTEEDLDNLIKFFELLIEADRDNKKTSENQQVKSS